MHEILGACGEEVFDRGICLEYVRSNSLGALKESTYYVIYCLILLSYTCYKRGILKERDTRIQKEML